MKSAFVVNMLDGTRVGLPTGPCLCESRILCEAVEAFGIPLHRSFHTAVPGLTCFAFPTRLRSDRERDHDKDPDRNHRPVLQVKLW